MNEFEVYPAIDLRQGRVVRLRQGDPAQETAYDNDPLAVARRWQEAGARWLHVVNLDGAFGEKGAQSSDVPRQGVFAPLRAVPPRQAEPAARPDRAGRTAPSAVRPDRAGSPARYGGRVGRPERGSPARHGVGLDEGERSPWLGVSSHENLAALKRILGTGLPVQFGGGLRNLESLRRVLELGVRRAILGTLAVEGPALLEAALSSFGPERIAVAIDARRGLVRTHGWQQGSALSAVELAQRCAKLGVQWIIHTDVARDGMGRGLNVEASRQLAQETQPLSGSGQRLHVIASGGVASLSDVQHAQRAGLSGVIIGRALYQGSVRLEDALEVGRMGDAG